MIVAAGGDLSVYGSNLDAAETVTLTAEGDTTIQAAQDFASTYTKEKKKGGFLSSKKDNTYASEATQNVGAEITAGGDVLINAVKTEDGELAALASNDVSIIGAEISADGDVAAVAGGDLTLSSQEQYEATLIEKKKKGFLSKKHTKDEWEKTTLEGGSVEAGGDVTLAAGDDASVNAGIVHSTDGDIAIAGGLDGSGSVEITGAPETQREYHYEKKSGFFAGFSGGGFGLGWKKEKHETEASAVTNAPSIVVADVGNVSIEAADDIDIIGSHVAAGDNINLSAGNDVNITEARETSEYSEEHKTTSIGVTVGAYENVSGAANAVANSPGAITSGQGGASATAVTAVSQGLATYGAVTGAINNAAGVNASVGFSSSSSESIQSTDTAYGSTLEAGGDINVDAENDIGVSGSVIAADGDISLDAGNDITIESAQNYTEQDSSSSSTGVSVGVGIGVGAGGITPTLSANASYNESDSEQSANTQANSVVAAGGDISLTSGNDTTIAGANVSGTDININVGGDLTVASRQDTSEGENSSFGVSIGGSVAGEFAVAPDGTPGTVSVGPGGLVVRPDGTSAALQNGAGVVYLQGGDLNVPSLGDTLGVNVGVNVGSGSNDSAIVTDQTTIIGTGDVDINVGEHTQVDGAVIAALDPDTSEDTGNLSLSTGTLEVTDLFDTADSSQTNTGVSVSVNDPFEDGVSGSDLPSLNAGYSSSDFDQTTLATIGDGDIEVRDDPNFDPDTINRDIGETQIVTRNDETNFTVNLDVSTIADFVANFDNTDGNSTIERFINEIEAATDGDPSTRTNLENDLAAFQLAATIEARTDNDEDEQALIFLVQVLEVLGLSPADINDALKELDNEALGDLIDETKDARQQALDDSLIANAAVAVPAGIAITKEAIAAAAAAGTAAAVLYKAIENAIALEQERAELHRLMKSVEALAAATASRLDEIAIEYQELSSQLSSIADELLTLANKLRDPYLSEYERDRVQSRVKELETAGAAAQNSLAALDSEVSNLASSLTAAVQELEQKVEEVYALPIDEPANDNDPDPEKDPVPVPPPYSDDEDIAYPPSIDTEEKKAKYREALAEGHDAEKAEKIANGGGNPNQQPSSGDSNYEVKDPASGRTLVEIDSIEEDRLVEEKSATWAGDPERWAQNLKEQLQRYIDAREYIPGYEDADVGVRFTDGRPDQELVDAVENAMAELESENPDVDIEIEW